MDQHQKSRKTTPNRFSPVVELRQYTLHPGKRDMLIDVFDRYLVEGQEDTGMNIIGQFRDLDRPDHFVWMRGFDDMEARRQSLETFYNGPVWRAHRDAANATMIDSDDVLLLRPARPGTAFELAGSSRGPQDAPADAPSPDRSVLLASTYHVTPKGEDAFVAGFESKAAPLLALLGAEPIAAYVTEHAENTFAQLPVRANENVFIAFSRFADRTALASHRAALAASQEWRAISEQLGRHLSKPAESYRLVPTARSLLA
ncbi:NIPSNAP protein [Mesorhizobium albiziae]|uniref:NIPSNAP protein n=1 Tax=Neomesorhizobium albiziae TaxID=335020 RepID=A0A1I4B4U9_9HYPH|nr:NIPSNAP family protein [Mesorhizobium albiziae]GLS34279.1 NIPSNAP family containing protein [Mesorhizobium albiziae]SFK62896.1 NIPSNAP protein [Mesorhizobium albiziae]